MLRDLGLGVAGNLATSIVLRRAEGLRETSAGKALVKAGLLTPDFSDRLTAAVTDAASRFFEGRPDRQTATMVSFFSDPAVISSIGDAIIDAKPVDQVDLLARLADDLDLPDGTDQSAWPSGESPNVVIKDFLAEVRRSLRRSVDPAISLIGQQVSDIIIIAEESRVAITNLKREVSGLFDKALVDKQRKEWKDFEQHYLEHMASRFGRLTTPGARDLHGLKQSLSVAYISLNVRAQEGADPVRAERFLSDHQLLVVKGAAGSGKTTLLSYIVWASTQPDVYQGMWNGGVPFIIQLRTVARTEAGPPTLDRFVEYSVDNENWALHTPDGWVHDVLKLQKRAIVMIDGVDELPATRRPAFWDWLARFVQLFPDNRVVVTSRVLPGTVGDENTIQSDQWNIPAGFVEAQLQEMSDKDIGRFIEHWHDAVDKSKLEPFEAVALEKAKQSLPQKLLDPGNRRIRELCSTPLLCAMVCVLHWREEGYLPRQRVELYERCCEMLIEARDLKRLIQPPSGPLAAMSKNDKERVLQRLAFEMMNNKPDVDEPDQVGYRIEIRKEKAIQWLAPWIAGFQSVEARQCAAPEVLDYLIERTGLLREPAGGLIDFPHRTFQEYLAACAAGAEGQESFLANKASDDQWHETITLASGTTTGGVKFGHDLVEALLRRAERHKSTRTASQRVRKTCFALALGCIENLRQPDPQLRDKVLSHVDDLVPPPDESGARILAIAADAAVPHLSYSRWKDQRTAVVAACAQTLRLIGTSQARRTLEQGYLEDRREQVVAEVSKLDRLSLAQMPFVTDFVAKSGELPHFVSVRDLDAIVGLVGLRNLTLSSPLPKNVEKLTRLNELRSLTLEGVKLAELSKTGLPETIEELTVVGCQGDERDWIYRLPNLQGLQLYHIEGSLSWVGRLISLRRLSIGLTSETDFSSLGELSKLESLGMSACVGFHDISFVSRCRDLRKIVIEDCPVTDLQPIRHLHKLEELELLGLQDYSDTAPLSSLPSLKKFSLVGSEKVVALSELSSAPVQKMTLASLPSFRNCEAVTQMHSLSHLTLANCALSEIGHLEGESLEDLTLRGLGIQDLQFLSGQKNLTRLHLDDCARLSDVSIVGGLPKLREVVLEDLRRLSNVDALSRCGGLKKLVVDRCWGMESLVAIGSIASLEELEISRCDDLADITVLSGLKNLRVLSMPTIERVNDLSPLLACTSLKRIYMRRSSVKSIVVPEQLLPLMKEVSYPIYIGGRVSHRSHFYNRDRTYRYRARRRWLAGLTADEL